MELPLGNALSGQIVDRRSPNHRKAPQHVADWWFGRIRLWTMERGPKPEGRVAAWSQHAEKDPWSCYTPAGWWRYLARRGWCVSRTDDSNSRVVTGTTAWPPLSGPRCFCRKR